MFCGVKSVPLYVQVKASPEVPLGLNRVAVRVESIVSGIDLGAMNSMIVLETAWASINAIIAKANTITLNNVKAQNISFMFVSIAS